MENSTLSQWKQIGTNNTKLEEKKTKGVAQMHKSLAKKHRKMPTAHWKWLQRCGWKRKFTLVSGDGSLTIGRQLPPITRWLPNFWQEKFKLILLRPTDQRTDLRTTRDTRLGWLKTFSKRIRKPNNQLRAMRAPTIWTALECLFPKGGNQQFLHWFG